MQNGEKGFEPVWCPFYREDSGRSIYCEGITDESFLRLTFASGRAKREEHGGQETGVRVVFEQEAEEFSE